MLRRLLHLDYHPTNRFLVYLSRFSLEVAQIYLSNCTLWFFLHPLAGCRATDHRPIDRFSVSFSRFPSEVGPDLPLKLLLKSSYALRLVVGPLTIPLSADFQVICFSFLEFSKIQNTFALLLTRQTQAILYLRFSGF